MKSIRERQRARAAAQPDRKDRYRRTYWRRVLGFWFKILIVVGGLSAALLLSIWIIWQLVQPPVPIYVIDRPEVELIAARKLETSGSRLNWEKTNRQLSLVGHADEPGLPPSTPRFGGPVGNVLAIDWAPLVAVSSDPSRTPLVYRPRDGGRERFFVQSLRQWGSDEGETEATDDWIPWDDCLRAIAEWARAGETDDFVPGRLFAASRPKTVVLFCDLHELQDPSQLEPAGNFAYRVQQMWEAPPVGDRTTEWLKRDFADLEFVVVLSQGPWQENLWEPQLDTTVFRNELEQNLKRRLDWSWRQSWLGRPLEQLTNRLVQEVGHRSRQLESFQQPLVLATGSADVYWGNTKAALQDNRPIPEEGNACEVELESVWRQLSNAERRLLLQDPITYQTVIEQLLCLEQFWAARLVPSSNVSVCQFNALLDDCKRRLEFRPEPTPEPHLSLWQAIARRESLQPYRWSLWTELNWEAADPADGLAEGLADRMSAAADPSEKQLLENWQHWWRLSRSAPRTRQALREALDARPSVPTGVVWQEWAYVQRLHDEFLWDDLASDPSQQASLLAAMGASLHCRDQANFLAAVLYPGLWDPEARIRSIGAAGVDGWPSLERQFLSLEETRRVLEDLLFANQAALPEFPVRLTTITTGQSLDTAFVELQSAYRELIDNYQTAVKQEVAARQARLLHPFDVRYQWQTGIRRAMESWAANRALPGGAGLEDEAAWQPGEMEQEGQRTGLAEQEIAELRNPDRDHRSVRKASQLLQTPRVPAPRRPVFRSAIREQRTLGPGDKPSDVWSRLTGSDYRTLMAGGRPPTVQGTTLPRPISPDYQRPGWEQVKLQRVVLDRWETPRVPDVREELPFYRYALEFMGIPAETEPPIPFGADPLFIREREHSLGLSASADAMGFARVWERRGRGPLSALPGPDDQRILHGLRMDLLAAKEFPAQTYDDHVALQAYFRGYTRESVQVRGPRPVIPTEPKLRSVIFDSKRMLDPNATQLSLDLHEPRDYKVVFVVDGSGSMNKTWPLKVDLGDGDLETRQLIPRDVLMKELEDFIVSWAGETPLGTRTDPRIYAQILFFSTARMRDTRWDSVETRRQTLNVPLKLPPEVPEKERDWRFMEQILIHPRSQPREISENSKPEWLELIRSMEFRGNTPLEYTIDLAIREFLSPSDANTQWLLVVISDGCDQLFATPADTVPKIDGRPVFQDGNLVMETLRQIYRQFDSRQLLFPDGRERCPPANWPENVHKQIYYFNFLETADLPSDRELRKIFEETDVPTGQEYYALETIKTKIEQMKQRGFRILNRLEEIEGLVKPKFPVRLAIDEIPIDRSLTHAQPLSLRLGRMGLSWEPVTFRVAETADVAVPYRGGESYAFLYSERRRRIDWRRGDFWQGWLGYGSFDNALVRDFSLFDENNRIVGRPDFVFLEVDGGRPILQDASWEPMGDNVVRVRLEAPRGGGTDEQEIVNVKPYIIQRPLDESLAGMWHTLDLEFVGENSLVRLGLFDETDASLAHWLQRWKLKSLPATDDRLTLILELDDADGELPEGEDRAARERRGRELQDRLEQLVVQLVDPENGRIPWAQSPNNVKRKYHYRDEQLVKIEMEFNYNMSERGKLVWGFLELSSLPRDLLIAAPVEQPINVR